MLPRQALFSADEVALVTGGASGIGRATARALAVAGARVVIVDTDAHAGAETVRSIHSAGGDARQFVADVSCATDVERVMSDVIATCGRLDVACNCAGIVRGPGLLVDVTEGDWNANLTVNLTGVWLCMKYEIPALQLGGQARLSTSPLWLDYARVRGTSVTRQASTESSVSTRAAALQYAREGIRINAACPGYIDTPLMARSIERMPDIEQHIRSAPPVGRVGRPEEVAAAIVWLCSESASYVTGCALAVDGGLVV